MKVSTWWCAPLVALSLTACSGGDDVAVDAAPDGPPSQTLRCPVSAGFVSTLEAQLLGANSTRVFYAVGSVVLASTGEGDPSAVPAAPSGFGRSPAFSERSYFSLDQAGSAIVTVDLEGSVLPRFYQLPPGRKVLQMTATGQDAVVLRTVEATIPYSKEEVQLFRAGAEAPEQLLGPGELSLLGDVAIAGNLLIWRQASGEESVVKKMDLTTRVVSELVTIPIRARMMVSGEWLFIQGAEAMFGTQRYSLATGELLTTYSPPSPPRTTSFLAVSGERIFGAAVRNFDFLLACFDQPPLYTLTSDGAEGSVRPVGLFGNGRLVVLGNSLFFSEEVGGGRCAGPGSPSQGGTYRVLLHCARIGG